MNDGAFGLASVIFHLVLVAVLHGSRSPRVFKSRRTNKVAQCEYTFRPSGRRAETLNR